MKYLSMLLAVGLLCTSGCSLFQEGEDPKKIKFEQKRDELQREVDLLRLERRKLLLIKSIDKLDSEMPEIE